MDFLQKIFVILLSIITAGFIVIMVAVPISLNLDKSDSKVGKANIVTKNAPTTNTKNDLEILSSAQEEKEEIIKNIDFDIEWLKRKSAEMPEATQAALESCNEQLPNSRVLSELVHCIHNIIGD